MSAEFAAASGGDEPGAKVDDLDFELTDLDDVVDSAQADHVPAGRATRPRATDGDLTVESLLDDLETVTAERNSHLEDLQRVTAEFANYRKQTDKRHAELRAHAAASLVDKLLPVLDACEAAQVHEGESSEGVAAISQQLFDALERSGLERLDPLGEVFDPERDEAVLHEDGEGGEDGPIVVEVMRTGYAFNGRVLRATMVKVQG